MEKILRKLVEFFVMMLAYIPLGLSSVSFLLSIGLVVNAMVLWVKRGVWAIPRVFEIVNTDFLSILMAESFSGFRLSLIQTAAKTANLSAPLFLLIVGALSFSIGFLLMYFSRMIRGGAKS